MNTRAFRGLCALVLVTSANGALYNLSDEALLEGGTTAVNQPTISSIPAVIINGGLFQRGAANSGSGTFRDLVRFDGDSGQPNGFDSGQHAYNRDTDGSSFQDSFIGQEDGVIQVQDMVLDSTLNYYVFRLDINNEGFTSIDQIQIWTDPNIIPGGVASNPNNYTELTSALGVTPNVYDLDAGSDNTIFLNSDDTPGSGSSELAPLYPEGKL
ncbi:hypothetical protein N9A94_05185 [Akkermansiaceae bacterium]|nr:hypothetical protein [Akkermansiaceae bacterium]